MCFYNDYDWYAEDETDESGESPEIAGCIECGSTIISGKWRRHIYQQQYVECQVCEYEEAEEPCKTHDYGELFECDICRSCQWILEAIDDIETEEGCPYDARQPAFGELRDAIWDDSDAGKRYLDRAIERHSEIAYIPWVVKFMEDNKWRWKN
jgi:hypothetical protein